MAEYVEKYLVPYNGLLDSCEVLEGRKKDMSPFGSSDILDEGAKFFAESNKDLVLILNGF
jgi:hypothetical protein